MKILKLFTILIFTFFVTPNAHAKTYSAGSLDPTFGVNGLAAPQVGDHSIANAAIMQNDGKIIIGGSSLLNGKKHFTLARYNPDGTLDTTFGADKNGIVVLNASEKAMNGKADGEDEIFSMALQGDKILVGGHLATNANDHTSAIARFNSDGTLDNNFQGSGISAIAIQGNMNSIDLQSDEKIIVNIIETPGTIIILRLEKNGKLDNTFGNMIVPGAFVTIVPGAQINSLKVQTSPNSKNKILFAGSISLGMKKIGVISRITPNGNDFDTFGITGNSTHFNLTPGKDTEVQSIFLQSDGKILLGATTNEDFAMIQCNENCNDVNPLIQITDIDSQSSDVFNAILQQSSDGKIIAVGSSSVGIGAPHFTLVRYNSDGTLDTTFGQGGKVMTRFPDKATSEAKAVFLQSDGKILAVGFTADIQNSQFAIARYLDKPADLSETPGAGSGGGGGGGCGLVDSTAAQKPILILFLFGILFGFLILRQKMAH